MGLREFFKSLFARRVKVDEIANEDIIIVCVFSDVPRSGCSSDSISVIGPTGAGKSSVSISYVPGVDEEGVLIWLVHQHCDQG